jgi:hypothetical protein
LTRLIENFTVGGQATKIKAQSLSVLQRFIPEFDIFDTPAFATGIGKPP